jgi:hypothetical protein
MQRWHGFVVCGFVVRETGSNPIGEKQKTNEQQTKIQANQIRCMHTCVCMFSKEKT